MVRSVYLAKSRIGQRLVDGGMCADPHCSCRFTHDLDAYLKIKGEDLGDRCVQFDLFGK